MLWTDMMWIEEEEARTRTDGVYLVWHGVPGYQWYKGPGYQWYGGPGYQWGVPGYQWGLVVTDESHHHLHHRETL